MTEKCIERGGIVVCGGAELTDAIASAIVELVKQQPSENSQVLGGRRSVTHATIESIGKVVIKHYTRGGIIGRIVRERYLRLGRIRSEIEYSALREVRNVGVRAPEPIAYAFERGLSYRAWLVTREIEKAESLAELAIREDERLENLIQEAMKQVLILVREGWRHVDLHAGNVLVDPSGAVWIIDFDRATKTTPDAPSLRNYYLCRWRRAIIKHNLPDILAEVASLKLRERIVSRSVA